MSVFNAEIKIKDNQNEFYFGDIIEGELILHTKDDIEVKTLNIMPAWSTKGKGSCNSQYFSEYVVEIVKNQKFSEGHYSFDFKIRIPDRKKLPESYLGNVLSIIWELNIKVDIKNNSLKKLFHKEYFEHIINVKNKEGDKRIITYNSALQLGVVSVVMAFVSVLFGILFLVTLLITMSGELVALIPTAVLLLYFSIF